MKKHLSHIVPLLFLCSILLPFVSLLFLQGAQYYLQGTAGQRMQEHKLVTILLPAANVVWHKQDKELSIEGKLFDVKSFHFSNGTLTATGFYDNEEISLVRLLSKLVSPEKKESLLHFVLVLQCFTPPLFFFFFDRMREENPLHHSFFSFLLPYPFCPMPGHPPQC